MINTTTKVNYCAETLIVMNIHDFHIRNIVLKNAIKSLDVGIIIISFGSVLDQTYSNVTIIHVRFAKESSLIFIEENLPGVKI
ncbi:MAG: hypothetical protein M3250_06505 [Thermoproteota archaeon]|nr:hypothetical protein [Thermoproteota archaeon]